MFLSDTLVLIRGGGDLGTGVAHRLHRAGFTVMVTELPQPLVVRRAVAFAEVVYSEKITVEGVTAHLAPDPMVGMAYTVFDEVPVVVDAEGAAREQMRPAILVDARMAKRNLDTRRSDAPLVIALGPGFTAGVDCHAVVETHRGHNLGRVHWEGSAERDTGEPEPVQGVTRGRVLRAPRDGIFAGQKQIGDLVKAGETVAVIRDLLTGREGESIMSPFDGVVRGLLHDGLRVKIGMKVGDIDPRGVRDHCFLISDKARAVGGGVLEATLAGSRLWMREPPPEIRDRGLP